MSAPYLDFYRGRGVLVTGGLGFIGSNLARRLADLGADVCIVDSLIPDYGGNLFNIDGYEDRVSVQIADTRQPGVMDDLVRDREIIFNLAGQVSHIDSMRDPQTDLDINCRAQLTLLEACRAHNPGTKVVFAGTRQVYGKPERLPVDESHLVRPTDINGINKAAGEYYHLVYNNVFGVRACSLRLTNIFGPRQLIRHSRQGFIAWFIRLALEGSEIQVFGDGSQIRDFVYVDDATDAFLRAGATPACDGDVFNVGGREHLTHRDLVATLLAEAGAGSVRYVEWPEDQRRIDIGSFYSDSSKFHRATGWAPGVSVAEGLRRTLAFYREHMAKYVDAPVGFDRAMTERVPFLSLVPGPDAAAVRAAIDRVIARGWFVLGPEVEAFEAEFATAAGAEHAISVGNGTDALALSLRAMGIGPGDEVITSPLSAAFSALAIQMAGATPVFADVDPDRLTMHPGATGAAVTSKTAAVMPVHLYGQPADMPALMQVAERHNLAVLEDACQAHFATCDLKPVGSFGAAAGYSFYPTKNLGALGDAGAITTNDAALAAKLRRLRNGGQASKYRHVEFGVNSRLDEMQAAILRARLPLMPEWTMRRRDLARQYRRALDGAPASITVPPECDPGHVYHLFTIRTPARDAFQKHLAGQGVGTLVHYPASLPDQAAFGHAAGKPCPVARRVAREICSLPLHPSLSGSDIAIVAEAVRSFS